MTLKRILGGLLDVIFPSFEVEKPGTGDRDVYFPRPCCVEAFTQVVAVKLCGKALQ